MHEAGAVDEDMRRAEVLHYRLCERIDGGGRAHVELDALLGTEALELAVVQVARNDNRAFRDEGLRDGAADALAGRGSDGDLALQAVGHLEPPGYSASCPGIDVRRTASLR